MQILSSGIITSGLLNPLNLLSNVLFPLRLAYSYCIYIKLFYSTYTLDQNKG